MTASLYISVINIDFSLINYSVKLSTVTFKNFSKHLSNDYKNTTAPIASAYYSNVTK